MDGFGKSDPTMDDRGYSFDTLPPQAPTGPIVESIYERMMRENEENKGS